MGVIAADITVPSDPVLTKRDVTLLSCAMSHILIDKDKLTDPYFTHEEWSKVLKNREKDFDALKKLLCQEDTYLY